MKVVLGSKKCCFSCVYSFEAEAFLPRVTFVEKVLEKKKEVCVVSKCGAFYCSRRKLKTFGVLRFVRERFRIQLRWRWKGRKKGKESSSKGVY